MRGRESVQGSAAAELGSARSVRVRIEVEAPLCIGCGHCHETAPENLDLDPVARHSVVIKQPEGPGEARDSMAAADSCPTGALQAFEGS